MCPFLPVLRSYIILYNIRIIVYFRSYIILYNIRIIVYYVAVTFKYNKCIYLLGGNYMDSISVKWKDMYCCVFDEEVCKRPKPCKREVYNPAKWGYMMVCSRNSRQMVPFATMAMRGTVIREGGKL